MADLIAVSPRLCFSTMVLASDYGCALGPLLTYAVPHLARHVLRALLQLPDRETLASPVLLPAKAVSY